MRTPESLPISTPSLSSSKSQNPGINRINNRTSGRVAALIAATGAISAAAGCGGRSGLQGPDEPATVIIVDVPGIGCSPTPDCPQFMPYPGANQSLYDYSGRWRRIDPITHKEYMVCDPTERTFCTEGQLPEKDGCSPPVCKDAKACDPIPSTPSHDVWRNPERANFPTKSSPIVDFSQIYQNDLAYPVIYDNAPDCQPGETPLGQTYYSCDVIPTCPDDKLIKYCDPLPRCAPGEQPIKVTDQTQTDYKFSDVDQCYSYLSNNINGVVSARNLEMSGNPGETSLAQTACQPQTDSSGTFYAPPVVEVVCIPLRECNSGEIPIKTSEPLVVHIDAGKWGSWTSTGDSLALSCDPIPSCK